jgi:hydrogenase 3 maturation protease
MQADLPTALKRALTAPRPDRPPTGPVVVLGVGSELRSDDGVGLVVARAVAARGAPGLVGIPAGPAPENSTAEIRGLSPSHVVIVDAADMGELPGTARLLDPADALGASFATHGLPLSVLAGYIASEMGCGVCLVGIQPASLEFGEALSPAVSEAAERVIEAVTAAVG